ncbi:hypothetical protein [Paenibacillus hubeiensis]|uniref:hypothetical protein n=1 Tax=Paenibacillus hubeiensis TaxID=3077330 RepID=UPI0031BB93DA
MTNITSVLNNTLSRYYLTPEQASDNLMNVINNRIPTRWQTIVLWCEIAGYDTSAFVWLPVDQQPGERMEDAVRRVQLGSTIIGDETLTIIMPNSEFDWYKLSKEQPELMII